MWEIFSENPERAKRFGRSMSLLSDVKGYEPHFLLENYPWEALGAGTVVDVGGSHGSVMVSLAERFPRLECVVQDLEATVEEGRKMVPERLDGRVRFMAQ